VLTGPPCVAAPGARALAERGCVSAALPTPAFFDGPPTPADERPTLAEPCAAGPKAVLNNSRGWLARVQAYQLQGAGGNAGVIAMQLCAEREYQSLVCLSGDPASMTELASVHDQACALADQLARAALAGDPLRPNEVRPLTFGALGGLFEGVQAGLATSLATKDVQQAALQAIGQREADAAASAEDRVGLAARQQAEDEAMAAGYAAAIRQVEGQIDAKQRALGIDQQRLGERLSAALTSAQDTLTNDKKSAKSAAQRSLVKSVFGLLWSVGLAVLAAPATGGASVVGAVSSVVAFVAEDSDVRAKAKALGEGIFDHFKCSKTATHIYDRINAKVSSINAYDIGSCDVNQLGCGYLDADACANDKAAIRTELEKLAELHSFVASISGLAALCNAVLDPSAEVSVADLPRVALLTAAVGSMDASTSIQIFTKAAMLGDVGTDVAQLVALLTSKLEMLTNYHKAKLASQDTAVRGQMFAREARRAQGLTADSAARSTALDEYYSGTLYEQCYVALRYHVQRARAFEFMALREYVGLDSLLAELKRERKTVQAYKDLLDEVHLMMHQTIQPIQPTQPMQPIQPIQDHTTHTTHTTHTRPYNPYNPLGPTTNPWGRC
jgi:hypothetical protein